MEAKVIASNPSWGRAKLVVLAAAYVLAALVVANLAFGTGTFFTEDAGRPARTGSYNTRIPIVTPVDPNAVGKAITEADGGPPTVGKSLPQGPPSEITRTAGQTAVAAVISSKTTPTYNAVTRVSSNPRASLFAQIPTFLTFPSHAHPHRK